jgi:MFS family permease
MAESDPDADPRQMLKRMDEAGVTRFHWKVLITAGMGFFTDAYDLFIIGAAMRLIAEQWHPSTFETAMVTSTALLASAVGAVLFGRVADLLGRKRIYGVEVLVLAAGAIASAFAPDIWWLIGFRVVLGLGIGGDYPVSSTIMSEYAGKASRGFLISLVFAAQGFGLIVGPLVAAGLLALGVDHDLAWRIMLGLGAIPALSVFYLRRQIHETPRYTLAAGHAEGASRAAARAHGTGAGAEQASGWRKPAEGELGRLFRGRLLTRLIGVCGAWFLMDFAYYGNTVSSSAIIGIVDPGKDLLKDTLILLGIFTVAAFPGYFVAALTVDRLGRKRVQILGFVMMALAFGLMGVIPNVVQYFWPFLVLYGLSFFFTQFGPNTTTFIYPAEIFPVQLRTTGHGLAAGMGKLGGFVGVFLFPYLMRDGGLPGAELVAAGVSLLGAVVTWFLLPETKGKSLEELSEQVETAAGPSGAAVAGAEG